MWSDIKTTGAQSNEVITQVNKLDAEKIVAQLKALLSARGEAGNDAAAQSASERIGVAEELGKLAVLRDQGVLTEEEFAAQKRKLLGN